MGAGSAPEVKLPDVGLVFGISLLIGYTLMTIKSGSDFTENMISNIIMIILGISLTVYGVYFGILLDSSSEDEIIDAEFENI